jgi:hypothetical protein
MDTKKIEVEKGQRQKIAELFKCDRRTVFNALRFRSDSAKSIRIRVYALENGGVLFETNKTE